MSSRKERKEALRREREERERQAREQQRRKRLVGIGIGGALAVAAIAVVLVLLLSGGGGEGGSDELLPGGGDVPQAKVTDLRRAASAAGCRLSDQRARSRDHSQDPNERIRYRTNPPTNGKHYEIPTEDGAYSDPPPDSNLVHSLEHGRIIIWFKPSLPESARASLKAFFDEDSYQIVLTPRSGMRHQIAASAWGREPEQLGTGFLLACPRYSEKVFDALRTFRDEHRSNGPEPVP